MSDDLKKRAALAAMDEVPEGAVLGIGTGSTAEAFIRVLAERVADGFLMSGIATSQRTQDLCEELSIPMTTLGEHPVLDVTVDGADEIGPDLTLIKGGGGALLREKIVASASRRMIVIADASKKVGELGAFPLPIEVNAFGIEPTRLAVTKVCRKHGMIGEVTLRIGDGDADNGPVVSDGGHYTLDAQFGRIAEPETLARDLLAVPGVVEHGLFVGLATLALIAGPGGVERIERS